MADENIRMIAELEADISAVVEIRATNQRAEERIEAGATDQLDYAALGFTIHNIYGVIENTACELQSTSRTTLPGARGILAYLIE